MHSFRLIIPPGEHKQLVSHLLRPRPRTEEAAFVFCQLKRFDAGVEFHFLENYLVPAQGFAYRSLHGIELTDSCRSSVIKHAHDLDACLIEWHSHPKTSAAEFSPSDRSGFADFVPHVMWRLKRKPYGAIVVGPQNFDSLFWSANAHRPDGALVLQVGERVLAPTGLTIEHWDSLYEP